MSEHEEPRPEKEREEGKEPASPSSSSLGPEEPSSISETSMPSDTSKIGALAEEEALGVVSRSQEADMKVSQFNTANGFNIQGQSTSFTAGVRGSAGLFGANISGDTRFSTGSYQYGAETSSSQVSAAGSLHMEATLEPRADIQLPKPLILQKGPRLKLTADTRQDITDTATPPVVTGRQITLTAELKDKANNPLSGKRLECRTSQSLLNYTITPVDGKTDSNGQLKIEIKREGAAFDKNKPPESVVVNVWLGLINEQVVINI